MHTGALLRVGEAQRIPCAADQLAVQHLPVGARQVLQLASLLVPDDRHKVVPRGLRVRVVSVDHALLRGDDLEQLRVPAMRGAELRRKLDYPTMVRGGRRTSRGRPALQAPPPPSQPASEQEAQARARARAQARRPAGARRRPRGLRSS